MDKTSKNKQLINTTYRDTHHTRTLRHNEMKPTSLIIGLFFLTVFQGLSQDLTGTYENDCHEKMILKIDSTFYYTNAWDWAIGTWEIQSGKLSLTITPVLDTVDTTFELSLEGTDSVYDLNRPKKLKESYTVTSIDTAIDNYDIITADLMSVACCGRQLTDLQTKYEIKENEIIKLRNQDYPDCKRFRKITVPNTRYSE